jgi:hypothetical protein
MMMIIIIIIIIIKAIIIIIIIMSLPVFETEGSSSGRWFCVQLWYGVFHMHQYTRK